MESVFTIKSILKDPATGQIRVAEFDLRHTDPQFPGTEILQSGIIPLALPLPENAPDSEIIAALKKQGVCQSEENAQFVFEQMAFQFALNTMQKVERNIETKVVPERISDRQFFAVLEQMGRITYEEALQAVKTGDLPPAFEAFLASLDDDKQKSYRLFMEGETFFSRNHQITLDLAAFFKMTDQQVDAIFIEGDKL